MINDRVATVPIFEDNAMSIPAIPSKGHLSYYKEHGISPVKYRSDDRAEHFERRDSLYRSLGLPPLAFKGVDVLEVAPGSGQNSLYVACCGPAHFDLVEPNPAGRADIEAAYASIDVAHTVPVLHHLMLQEFEPARTFDIVLCENWLGALPEEVSLIRKLVTLVAPGGALVLTVVPLAGFFPNVMRKLIALRLMEPAQSFEARTELMLTAFGPHLATIRAMTRSHRDWVHDCMINPHYLHVALPLPTVLEAIGAQMEVLATYPRMSVDWRWFKGLTGEARQFNELQLEAFSTAALSFVDYRTVRPPLDGDMARRLEDAFAAFHEVALAAQASGLSSRTPVDDPANADVRTALETVVDLLVVAAPDLEAALREVQALWESPTVTADEVGAMTHFSALFGRETVYASFTKPLRG